MKINSRAFLVLIVVTVHCYGGPIELKLRASKAVYRVGNKIRLDLVFRNTSTGTVRIFPDPEIYYPATITISRRDGTGKVEEIELAERAMDYSGWSKDVISVAPNKSYAWSLQMDLSKHLPSDWKEYLPPGRREKKSSVYLVFVGGSALRLPGLGEYTV